MDKTLLLEALKAIDLSQPNRFGICGNVGMYLSEKYEIDLHEGVLMNVLNQYFSRWPDFSGICPYPVPHPTLTPKAAFELSAFQSDMFDPKTEYGKARRSLLTFIITALERELQND